MIEDNQKRLNQLHVVIDGLIIILSYTLSYVFIFEMQNRPQAYDAAFYFWHLIVVVPGMLILYWMNKLYTPKRVQGRRREFANLVWSTGTALLVFMAYLYLGKEDLMHFSRRMVLLFFALNLVLDYAFRLCLRYFLRRIRKNGHNQKSILLIGYSRAAQAYIDRVQENPVWGYNIRGILDDHAEWGTDYKGVRVLGPTYHLDEILKISHLDEIAITLGLQEYDKLEQIVVLCEKSGVHTKFIPDYSKIIPTTPYTEDLLGLPVIHIRYVPLSDSFNMATKRAVDIIGAAVALLLFSPIMLITAIGVKLSSPGPILFKQERIGLHNRPFMMYKFRSMAMQTEEDEAKGWTKKGDPRVTRFGRFIRKTSIDELPQMWNVLKGNMSLVGPRPERPQYVEKFKEEIPRYMVKHQVRPGITGWAQVNGYRGDTSISKRIECDLYYIENWTLGLDFKIILLTFVRGFVNKNAY
ncbi:MAG: undecaprenyl-phosphate glucose phosphotransferase [Lachnospiraceae bacterium]|nr:undecaprenyl-phosphate glucose phosphotransferase [Lachnospiraceae bacterium]